MSYCRNCGSKIDSDSLFCANCGFQLREQSESVPPAKVVVTEFAPPEEVSPSIDSEPVAFVSPRRSSNSSNVPVGMVLGLFVFALSLAFLVNFVLNNGLNFSGVFDGFGHTFDGFGDVFGALGGALGEVFGALGGALGEVFGGLGGALGEVFGGLGGEFGQRMGSNMHWSFNFSGVILILVMSCFFVVGVGLIVRAYNQQKGVFHRR
ncbi:MAG: zinc-ribbon domain-containing protein [Candidatus Hodarchaeales archaeon]|jgi:hypothetical protein